jgi:hypothetical protein
VHNPITTEAECRAGIAAVEVCAARMESARAQASLTLHYITPFFIVHTRTLLTKSYIAKVLHTVSTFSGWPADTTNSLAEGVCLSSCLRRSAICIPALHAGAN